ncbi:MAG TPA: DUF3052 domain-containing protein [Streptomyces sp.]|jgi:hypothetical protein|nr:DUF3052 domain-containing protein [Streptomyces sp.]
MTEHSPGRKKDQGPSRTPLVKKLGIKPGHRIRLAHCPSGWEVPDLPGDCEVVGHGMTAPATAHAPADVTLAFYRSLSELSAEAPDLVGHLADAAMLWIAWPRRAAGHVSDITENALRELFLPLGVVDVKVAALGEDWSGLKFVRRKANRSSP